ncbi:MAG: hypothetical protein Q4C54_04515 [Clostridia bacterium]|nr:hypothetical protein [Clostridia bacterium]
MTAFVAILLVAALFLAALLNLAADTSFRNRMTGCSAAMAACIGIVMYGYAFMWQGGLGVIPVLRALLTVCRMFGGVNDAALVQSVPLWQGEIPMTVFWVGHFLAFYATASTAIATLGGRLLHRLRTMLLRRGDLLVIFGANSESIDYARTRQAKQHLTLLFVDDSCDSAAESAIAAMGGLVEKSASALSPDAAFLRHIGMVPGKRMLHAAAMHPDGLRNLAWAQQLLSALTDRGIQPRQTTLLVQGVEEQQAGYLLAQDGPGFGNVFAYDAYGLAARLMTRRLPPCRTIAFDEAGRAVQDVHAVIIGFGQMGRAALKQLAMNGQFCGSDFRADVFDSHAQAGSLLDSQLLQNHHINFHASDGRSNDFYAFLREYRDSVNYIVISTGRKQQNQEIAQEITAWYGGFEHLPAIVQLTKESLLCSEGGKTDLQWQSIYASDALDFHQLDRLAMVINQQYCAGNGLSAEDNWKRCDYFSRISCRASADFAPAFPAAVGLAPDAPLSSPWPPREDMLENLAQTEHLRWCAFHEVMGYHTMPEDIWQERASRYAAGEAIRIGKDTQKRLHACLIPWEQLDDLSARENAVTGGKVDYKAMDRSNVLALPDLMRQAAEEA